MPLILYEAIQPEGELGVWRIEETEDWFRERLELAAAEEAQLSAIKGRRRTEWLAARQLVHDMSGREERGVFIKDEFGKPRLEGTSWHISISHSHNLAAAIAAPRSVGIDVQFLVTKIERLAHKFMRPEEMASLHPDKRLEHLHVYWGAKEALYKTYGRRELDFCTNILVDPFSFDLRRGSARARIVKEDFQADFQLRYRQLGDYILVYAVEIG
jgi:4'-phosphopantetheinyl transferase